MFLTKFSSIIIAVQIGKNKCFCLHWQNIGNRYNALVTIHKLLLKINMPELWLGKIYKCFGKGLAVIGNQYLLYQSLPICN